MCEQWPRWRGALADEFIIKAVLYNPAKAAFCFLNPYLVNKHGQDWNKFKEDEEFKLE